MADSKNIQIQILTGDGSVGKSFDAFFDGVVLFDRPVEIKRIGDQPVPCGPPAGVILNLPLTVLSNLSTDSDLKSVRIALKDVFEAAEYRVNFIIRSFSEEGGEEIEYNISSHDLCFDNIDGFFDAIEKEMSSFLGAVTMPLNAPWAIYINIDASESRISDVTCLNMDNRDFYVYDIAKSSWDKQAEPKEKLA